MTTLAHAFSSAGAPGGSLPTSTNLVVRDATGLGEARELRQQGAAALARGPLFVDLSAASLVGGAMQQVLLALHKEAALLGRPFVLRGLSAEATRSFEWTGLGGWARSLSQSKNGE